MDPFLGTQSTECLANPALDTHGGFWCDPNVSRGSLPGPMFTNVDFGISKSFKISERASFRFDANFFDLLQPSELPEPGQDGGGGNNFQSRQFRTVDSNICRRGWSPRYSARNSV